MSLITAEELDKQLREHILATWGNDYEDDEDVDLSDIAEIFQETDELVLPAGTFETVLVEGGEGCGDEYYAIARIKETGQLFRLSGYYSSWSGVDWSSDIEHVEAYEEPVVFYRPV